MKRNLNIIMWTIALSALWWFSGYAMIKSLGFENVWATICGSLNMSIGLIGLIIITRTPRGWRIFYEGPHPDEEGYLPIGLLFALPLGALLWAIVIWLVRFFMR